MADVKISEMASAVSVDETDNLELSQENSGVFTSVKASILAIANKIASGINFTSALQTTNKTLTGAINEAAQSGGSGGHTILNDGGTALSQEDNLQFVGVYSEDDSVNEKTVVNVVREMTQAQYDLLSAAEKKGIIRLTDKNYVCEASEVAYDAANNVSVKTELDSKVNWTTNGELGAKNFIAYPYISPSGHYDDGITFAYSGEGYITADGTSTGTADFTLFDASTSRLLYGNSKKEYIITEEKTNDNIYGIFYFRTSSGAQINAHYIAEYEDGSVADRTTYYVSLNYNNKFQKWVKFKVLDNVDFYGELRLRIGGNTGPYYAATDKARFMIRLADDNDNTWQPYTMTNKELTDVVNNVPTTAGTYTLQATRNADGTITYSWVSSV